VTAQSTDKADHVGADRLKAKARFLARHEPFKGLKPQELERIAASIVERTAAAGEAVLVESGPPGTELYVVLSGTLELVHKEVVVAIITRVEVFGHPTILTGLAHEFTTRARQDSTLYCIPEDVALNVLSRPEGVAFVARTGRERLIQAARMMRALPEVNTQPVTSLVRSAPVFCDAATTIREAAKLMAGDALSALLVRMPDGLGMVTDVDLRNKVVAGGISRDAPVGAIVTMPVKTVKADLLAPEASIEMIAAGVNHLPVIDAGGKVVGILSASNLMTLDARSPFALRRRIQSAHTEDDLAVAAADIPKLFVDLLDAHVEAPALTRILTVLSDAGPGRLLELAIARRGQPPGAYAWLVFGSAARNELTLASDQDNGLAYADSDDPAVDEYFRLIAEDVNEGLRRCGFDLDPHGVLARNRQWRMSLSAWCDVFSECLEGRDLERLARASVAFDFRQVAGDLSVAAPLNEIMRQAPQHRRFMAGLAQLGTGIPSPLGGFRQRLVGRIDIKKDALVPIQNLARYYAFARGISAHTTLERLVAVDEVKGQDTESERSLREAFISISHLQLRHHANAVRAGRRPDNLIDTAILRPLTRVTFQEALRVVAAAQKRFPRLATLH
jgi:CBS domain-containing protein